MHMCAVCVCVCVQCASACPCCVYTNMNNIGYVCTMCEFISVACLNTHGVLICTHCSMSHMHM